MTKNDSAAAVTGANINHFSKWQIKKWTRRKVPSFEWLTRSPIRHIRPIFPGLGRGLDLLLPSFLLSREEKKVPAGLRLSPAGAICGAYAFAPYKRGFAPRPLSPFLSLMRLNI